jgi:rhamnose utilization protein RhaD (predicted bifunctional aldolase and dehydrogenase)
MNNDETDILEQLIGLSRRLGEPARDLVILGDGNTSARIDDDTFWVKASGASLDQISADGFTRVRLQSVIRILEMGELSDEQIHQELGNAKVDPGMRHPSIETLLHGLAYSLCGASFVGHTHPVALNSILCSREARKVLNGHLFSETVLYLGKRPLILGYADPGLVLARELKQEILTYMEQNGEAPRLFYLLNHGLVALGKTAQEVENITAMAVKSARILLGTFAIGGPSFLTEIEVDRITMRPDEENRRNLANRK